MTRRMKKDDDYIGPSRGFMGLFHRFMMFLLFPLRKPWWFLAIVLVLFLAPTFRGVKPAEVHLWYWNHIKGFSTTASEKITNKAQQVMPNMETIGKAVDTIAPGIITTKETPSYGNEPQLVSQPARKAHRQAFGITEHKTDTQPQKDVATSQKIEQPQPLPTKAKATRKLNLRYLDELENISGIAEILNANEIKISEKIIFLYGIFVQPNSQKGIEAEIYLRRLTEGKTVNCQINAYTYQNIATAICMVDNININRRMVEQGYSQNVALD